MTLNEYCEYIKNPLAEAKVRVVTVPPGENWTKLRRFYRKHGAIELRLSNLVMENAWLPMPDEVFRRMREAMTAQATKGKTLVLLGMPGYLALLTDENKRAAIVALREWMDGESGLEAVCFLLSNDGTESILKDVFPNPRYSQGKHLIEIDEENVLPQFVPNQSADLTVVPEQTAKITGSTEVMLVGDDLASFIPEACETFQKYLQYTEEHPNDSTVRRIVVASDGRELAGLNAEVQQVVCLWDFARVFYGVKDVGLSEDALRWMCGRGKEGTGKTLSETLKTLFFPEGEVAKNVLRVFDERMGAEREAVLWLLKHVAPKGSYLDFIARQEGVLASNFRSMYVTGAAEWLDKSLDHADERRSAIKEAGVIMSGAAILQFISRCKGESTSLVAPWLNCETNAERAELLRRCAADGLVSNAVKNVYPETEAYLNTDPVFGDTELENYFREYRELKMADRVTPKFCEIVQRIAPPSSVQSRGSLVQLYASDNECALLMVDAMGAEWLPMLVTLANKKNIGVDTIQIGKAYLPTSTKFNKINWPDVARRLPDIKRFDNIAHNGVEAHEVRRSEENLAAALDVIGSEVLPNVAEGLVQYERVLVTADHGSSRLAMLAWQAEPRMAETITCETGAEIADWRYRERAQQGECPPEMDETLDGRYWVVRGYNRLPKKGGGQGFELHGGATLEEQLVPVVVFSRKGLFVPKTKTCVKRAQIVEKDDFDI